MRRSYYRKTGSPTPKEEQEALGSMQDLRFRILNIMLIGAAIVGVVVMAVSLWISIPDRNWGLVIVSVAAYLWVLWITFDRRLPYLLRAFGFVILPYMLGVADQLQFGVGGNSRVWLLGFSALTAIILGVNAGIGALLLSVITLFGSIALANARIIRTPEPVLNPLTASVVDWVLTGSVWLLIAGVVIVTSTMLIQGLTSSLDKERSLSKLLEMDREHLDRRTRELDRRLVQIRTAAEISRSLSGLMDLNTLLQQFVDLMQSRFGLYFVGVFLQDERQESAILYAGTGEAGEELINSGYQVPIDNQSNVGWVIANRKPRIAADTGREPAQFRNPLLLHANSEMVLPLISGDQVFGALLVQTKTPEAFDQDDMLVMQGIADSLTTSIKNVHLYDESRKNLQEIQALNRQYVVQAWKNAGETPAYKRECFENIAVEGPDERLTTQYFPILLRDQVIGQLALETDKQNLSLEEQTLVQEVTTQAALAMENIRLLEESQRRASLEHLLGNVVQHVRTQTDLEMILRSTVSELGKALGATAGEIYLTADFLEPDLSAPSTPDNGDDGSPDGHA